MYTASAPPTGAEESKMATATSAWTARFLECLASGEETQRKLR